MTCKAVTRVFVQMMLFRRLCRRRPAPSCLAGSVQAGACWCVGRQASASSRPERISGWQRAPAAAPRPWWRQRQQQRQWRLSAGALPRRPPGHLRPHPARQPMPRARRARSRRRKTVQQQSAWCRAAVVPLRGTGAKSLRQAQPLRPANPRQQGQASVRRCWPPRRLGAQTPSPGSLTRAPTSTASSRTAAPRSTWPAPTATPSALSASFVPAATSPCAPPTAAPARTWRRRTPRPPCWRCWRARWRSSRRRGRRRRSAAARSSARCAAS
eukprot:COSAG04_NODE_2941_length_3366_cov_380.461586_3_plen_270_part_00